MERYSPPGGAYPTAFGGALTASERRDRHDGFTMQRIETMKNVPTWRRVAASTWSTSDDPSIYGWIDIDATNLLAYVDRLRAQSGERVTVTHVVGKAVARAFADKILGDGMVR